MEIDGYYKLGLTQKEWEFISCVLWKLKDGGGKISGYGEVFSLNDNGYKILNSMYDEVENAPGLVEMFFDIDVDNS